jgi:hypothetical protein
MLLTKEENQIVVACTLFFNYLATTKDESGETKSNQAYTFLEWSTKE